MTTNLTYNYVYTTDDEVPVTVTVPVITSDMVIDTIVHHKDWSFYHASIDDDVASDTPELDRFIEIFREWLAEHQSDNDRICKAWLAEYNPIHNYDRNEDSTDSVAYDGRISETETGEQTETVKGKITHTYGEAEDQYINAEHKTTTKQRQGVEMSVSTYDSADKNVEKSEPTNQQLGDETVTDAATDKIKRLERTDTDEQVTPDKSTITGGHTNSHGAHEYGNIGITTTQQMITAEYELRIRALALRLLDNFCKEKLFILGDDENDCYFFPYGF